MDFRASRISRRYKEKVGAARFAKLKEMEVDNYHIPRIVTKGVDP